MMQTPVGDDAIKFLCQGCWTEIVFDTCAGCGFRQSIPGRWRGSFTCGRCGAKCDIPHRRSYGTSTKAFGVEGYARTQAVF
jgi:hypothetical protein